MGVSSQQDCWVAQGRGARISGMFMREIADNRVPDAAALPGGAPGKSDAGGSVHHFVYISPEFV
jgi:hypothetical protein